MPDYHENIKPSDYNSRMPKDQPVKRKEEQILETYESPLLPKLTRIIFIFYIIITAAMAAVDISNHLKAAGNSDLHHLFVNLATTGTVWSLIAGLILIPLCLLGMHMSAKSVWEKSGIPRKDMTTESLQRKKRAIHKLNRSYYFYIAVTLFILALFLLLGIGVRYHKIFINISL